MKTTSLYLTLILLFACTNAWSCPPDHYEQCVDLGGLGIVRQCGCFAHVGGTGAQLTESLKSLGNDAVETFKQNLSNAPDAISNVVEAPREVVQSFGCTLTDNQGRKIGGGECPQTEKELATAEKLKKDVIIELRKMCDIALGQMSKLRPTIQQQELRKYQLESVLIETTQFAPHLLGAEQLENIRQVALDLRRVNEKIGIQNFQSHLDEETCNDIDGIQSLPQKLYCMGKLLSQKDNSQEATSERLKTTLVLLPFFLQHLATEANDYAEVVSLVGPDNTLAILSTIEAAGGGLMLYQQQLSYLVQELQTTDLLLENNKSELIAQEKKFAQYCNDI
jgi:hypothetical protein